MPSFFIESKRRRRFVQYKFGFAAAIVALFAPVAFAQQAAEESVDEDDVIDEITVVATKRGSRRRWVDLIDQDPLRARVLKDLRKLKVMQEEYQWRTLGIVDSPPRIRWGYDPRDDYETRNKMVHMNADWNQTRPATLFRVGF